MKPFPGKLLVKISKISGLFLLFLLLLLFLIPYFFPRVISNKIKGLANSHIQGELNFSDANLSFFAHFPSLTLSLHDVVLKGSAPFEKDTLVAAHEIAFGVDLRTLFKKQINIDEVFLTGALINVKVSQNGKANYNIYVSKPDSNAVSKDTSAAALKIERIIINNSRLVYNDQSLPMLIDAKGFNYSGTGDLSKAIFDLHTKMDVNSLDFYYGGQPYLQSKKVTAELITKINTNSLAFVFEKNNLMINQLPVRFKGRFAFLSNGYDLDFKLQSKGSDLHDLITALPPEYLKWLDETEVKGFGTVSLALGGKYIAATHEMPGLDFKMKVWDGYIAHAKSPSPLNNLYLNLEAKLPNLDPENLYFNMDSLHFDVDKGYFNAVVRINGITKPEIYTKINTEIDLEKWQNALGSKAWEMKGQYALHLLADGKFAKGTVRKGLRKVTDTVVTSIPVFALKSSYKNGYLKYAKMPEGIHDINFQINAGCPDPNYKNSYLSVENLNVSVMNSFVKGYFKFGHSGNFSIDAGLKSIFQLADLRQVYPMDSISLEGALNLNIKTKGKYLPARRRFPVTTADISLLNGTLQTRYYPHPVKKINIAARIVNRDGSFKNMQVNIKPVSFLFEGQPFWLKANLQNFDDLRYTIASKGTVDIGKIYRVFALKGLNVQGKIHTNLALSGRQSDAANGNYSKLFNSGTLRVNDVKLSSELFPKPLLIRTGNFRFVQDKMKFEVFKARYGSTSLVLNGALSNVINYVMKSDAPLKGVFDLQSQSVKVDEFMAFADGAPGSLSSANTGVVIVPDNLDLSFSASAKKVNYQGLDLNDFKGQLSVANGTIVLRKTGFNLIGAPVIMDATYGSTSPYKAYFDYHISATDFDVKKAYQEIKLFRDMASAAAYAEGVVSLNYQLSGKLNENMKPVYPSLKGEGVLSVKQVKMKGFKLFNAVSNKTDHSSIKDPDVSKVDLKTTIANNIITLERTKMRVAGFRPRLEGQVNFDGQLNLKFRLGLPPFGILGIPMTITGTQDNPKISLGKGSKEDELEEVKDEEN